jgi:hypothetical protein
MIIAQAYMGIGMMDCHRSQRILYEAVTVRWLGKPMFW